MSSFALTDTQNSLFSMVRSFSESKIVPHAVDWDERCHLPVDVLRESAALGFGGLYVSDDLGGSALSRLDSAVAFEALSYGCPALAAFVSIHNMCAWMIDSYGDDSQRERFLPSLISMEKVASYCLTEPGSGSDASALRCSAVRDGDNYVLNGTKQFISGAGVNDIYLVMARTGEGSSGISCFVVEKDSPGLSFGEQEKKMGWHIQPTAQVILDDCRVPAENRLGDEGLGFRIALSGLDGGRLNIAACSLGGATFAFDRAVSYSGEREAFGRRIGEFQSLQFKLSDMLTSLESSRLMLYSAASKLDSGASDATVHCAMAKRHITDECFGVANAALQVHGGYGYLREYGIEKIVRDLRVHQILEGTNEIMRVIISRSLDGGLQ